MAAPRIIPATTRSALGEVAARTGEIVARQLFKARGNNSEVHLSELELAMIVAAAAHVSREAMAGRPAPAPRQWKVQELAVGGWADVKSSTDGGPYVTDTYPSWEAAQEAAAELEADDADPDDCAETRVVPFEYPADIDIYSEINP